ncbi:MAG: RNase H-like domain-containing protein [Pseudomonadota bacterium]
MPRGKFEFNVTPFGLCNAGASYQRMMDIALSGLPSDRILAYMDDIVVFNKTFQEHLQSLEQIFCRLRSSGISLKLSKCIFASEKVDFLGYTLAREGIKPQTRLTEAVKQYQRPSTKKELKGFLGLAGFYRSFIPNFSDISHPLNQLTSEHAKFEWSAECEAAFVTLKNQLSSDPVLKFPNFGQQFIVEADASNYAVGGVLSQFGSDGQIHPIAYFSTALQKSQQNWSATTKEAFALVLAVRHWRVYLAGASFILNSDHNPLTFLRTQKDPRGKLSRWMVELEEFNYTIQYIPGKSNVKADALSRNNAANQCQPDCDFDDKIYATFSDNDNFLEQLRTEQSRDPIIANAKRCILNGQQISKGRLKRVQNQLRIENDLLTKSSRPIIPSSLRKLIVSQYHNVAHFGSAKIYALLKERFFWPNMFNYVRTFTSLCESCQQSRCDTRPPKAPLLPMFIPNAPMQFLSIDIAYLPKDHSGYQYILLIGDVFSKYIQAIPLKDQTAPIIVDAFLRSWVYIHGTPYYLLSDQGSNVDGELMREVCNSLTIEKRRSSAYHSQGNGFAERHIRTVKDTLRSVLLHRKLPQTKWRKVLPELVFALNASESKSTNCVPYEVVFGRQALLPQDIIFDHGTFHENEQVSVGDYKDERLYYKMSSIT